jgi:hypothetical protein
MDQQLSPTEQLLRMTTGYWVSAALYVAAKLGVADLLAEGAQTARQLATKTDTHEQSLFRVLRALASVGVFAEDSDHRFSLTPLAEPLRSAPGSQRAFVIMMGEECYHSFGDLLGTVRSGETAFNRIYGKAVFPYLQEHPDKAAIFDQAMVGVHGAETIQMLNAYDFTGIATLADIGGGNGSLLCETLQKYPQMRGILFDLPGAIERAKSTLKSKGLEDRCKTISGDFFQSVPGGADAYLLRHIIHDWDDEKATAILRNIRRAISSTGKLLLVESVIPAGNDPSFGKLLDLTMLVMPGGQERTAEEYRRLLDQAGFKMTRIVPTTTDLCVVESQPA